MMAVITCKRCGEVRWSCKCSAAITENEDGSTEIDFACGGTDTEADVVNDAGFLHTAVDDGCLRTLFEIVQTAPVNQEALLCIMRGHPRFPAWLFEGDLLVEGPKPREFYLTVLRYMLDSAHWEATVAPDPMAITRSIARGS